MRDVLEPISKRERKKQNYYRAAATGKIPWTARGIETCLDYMREEFAGLTSEEGEDWCPHVASLCFIQATYGENLGIVHFLRMRQIINFIAPYRERLMRDGLLSVDKSGGEWWEGHLSGAFARLPFTMGSFKYEDVKRYIKNCGKPS
jgi:hypothetical protein